MTTAKASQKTLLIHPRTGRQMNIESSIYDIVSKAIYHELKKNKAMTWTDLSNGVKKCVADKKIDFPGSVEWYAISIRNDMETKGILCTYKEKGKTMNALAK
jgi:hypothetical protein